MSPGYGPDVNSTYLGSSSVQGGSQVGARWDPLVT